MNEELARVGNGAGVTAVRGGKNIDTSISFTPTAGLSMSTRSGDLDPGPGWYLSRVEQVTAKQLHELVNHESGWLDISEMSSDMRELLAHKNADVRAAEAVTLFCYRARTWICAVAGALEGLDTLVFAGVVGEHAPDVRARICSGLEVPGVKMDEKQNDAAAPVISSEDSAVTVRVICTDEELIIARTVCQVLALPSERNGK